MGNDLAPVLVTGATGYLGAHVLAILKRKQMPSVALNRHSCDLTDTVAVHNMLDSIRPSVIIHCAAVVPKSSTTYDNIHAAEASVKMTRAIAQCADCPIVFASSMTVYVGINSFPVREDISLSPEPAYARGKWLAEQILFERNFRGDVALRLPGLFGLPRRSGLLYNSAIAFLTKGKFELDPPSGIWAAMAVQDAAEFMVLAAESSSLIDAPQPINVGYNCKFSVLTATAEVASECGLFWESPFIDQPFSMCLDRLKQRYGLLPVTFSQRLAELVSVARCDLHGHEHGVFNV